MDHAQHRWHMATVRIRGATAIYEGSDGFIASQHQPGDESDSSSYTQGTTHDLEHQIRCTPRSLRWALESTSLPGDNGKAIAERIIRGTARVISDAAVKDNLGTAAAIAMDVDEDETYTVLNRTPGADMDVHSFQSKVAGILANVLLINCIAKTHDVHTGRELRETRFFSF